MFKKAKNRQDDSINEEKTPKEETLKEETQNNETDTGAQQAEARANYHAELAAIYQENQAEQATLRRELERRQNLIAAAVGMEKAAKDRLKNEQDELNRLEEESRAAILALAEAKQKSDSLTEQYNLLLERVKQQRTHADLQKDELIAQQQQAKQVFDKLQQQTYFAGRQQQILAAMEADEAIDTGDLPPLEDLQPQAVPQPDPATSAKSEKNHANADFWDKGSTHTALKLREAPPEENTDDPEPEAEQSALPRPSKLKTAMSYIICIALAVAVALAIRTWVLMPTEVSGTSMVPTLQSADKLLTSPLPYIWGEPQRGDIIVFQAPNEAEGVYYVKRVVGLPGERVLVDDGIVYIDGKPLNEPYLADTVTEGYVDTIVPRDSVFVLGDNRLVSHDSRANDVACISYDEIYGKAVWRIAPLDSFGTIY